MSRKTIAAIAAASAVAAIFAYLGGHRTDSVPANKPLHDNTSEPPMTAPIALERFWPYVHVAAGSVQVTSVAYSKNTAPTGVFRQYKFPVAPVTNWQTLLAPASSAFASLAVCDINQNGRWEIVVGGTLQKTQIYEMQAPPGFGLAPAPFAEGLASSHDAQLVCADFDGNGQQELLRWRMPAADQAGEWLRTAFNMATASWQQKNLPALPADIAVNDLQLQDVNHDGVIDVYLATGFAPGLTDPYAPWRKASDLLLLSQTAVTQASTTASWTLQTAESYWPDGIQAYASASARIQPGMRQKKPLVQSFNSTGQHSTIYGAQKQPSTLPLHVVGGFSWGLNPGAALLLSNMHYLPARDFMTPATHASTLVRELAQMGKGSVSQIICDALTTVQAAALCRNMLQGQIHTFATDPQDCTYIEAWFYRQKCLAGFHSRTGTFTHPLSRDQLRKQYQEMQPHEGPFARLDSQTLLRLEAPTWQPSALTRDTPWGLLLADLDLDGQEEVIYSNSYLTRYQSFLRVLQQSNGNTYTDIAHKLGIVVPGDTRGLVAADLDGDGDLDLATHSVFEGLVVLENQLGGDSITVDLVVDNSRALAHGASVELKTRSRTLTRSQQGRTWVSYNAAPMVLPLAATDLPATLVVHWPDASQDTVSITATNTLYRVQHGPLQYRYD